MEIIFAEAGATSGHAYAYDDTAVTVDRAYFYKLEAINNSGTGKFHGPVPAIVSGPAIHYPFQWGMIIFSLLLAATEIKLI